MKKIQYIILMFIVISCTTSETKYLVTGHAMYKFFSFTDSTFVYEEGNGPKKYYANGKYIEQENYRILNSIPNIKKLKIPINEYYNDSISNSILNFQDSLSFPVKIKVIINNKIIKEINSKDKLLLKKKENIETLKLKISCFDDYAKYYLCFNELKTDVYHVKNVNSNQFNILLNENIIGYLLYFKNFENDTVFIKKNGISYDKHRLKKRRKVNN